MRESSREQDLCESLSLSLGKCVLTIKIINTKVLILYSDCLVIYFNGYVELEFENEKFCNV